MSNIFKIATWNVNSLRVRLPHLLTWLKIHQPDVMALQETKLVDADFPIDAIYEAGYQVVFAGQRTYNGVATLARHTLNEVLTDIPHYPDPQRRVLAVLVNDIRIFNLYVPNGQSVDSAKYQYKINWLEGLRLLIQTELKKNKQMILLGDFNIAPHDKDVHDPSQWENQVLCSPLERSAFKQIVDLGFKDCFRMLTPDSQHFSWWDYRMNAFKRNLGLRIDHILSSDALSAHCSQCEIDKTPRQWERPSDHAPVIATFKLN